MRKNFRGRSTGVDRCCVGADRESPEFGVYTRVPRRLVRYCNEGAYVVDGYMVIEVCRKKLALCEMLGLS